MNDKEIKDILQIILDSLQGKKVKWHLAGSTNLKVQNVDVSVRDLDITTNDNGIEIFRTALKKFIIKDFFNPKINSNSLVCDINGFEIEINSYKDEKLLFLDKTEKILWDDLQIPVTPLKDAKRFYELINRKDKVDLLSKYLSS